MDFLEIIALLFLITSIGGYVNHKWLKLPNTIGLLLFSTLISIIIVTLHKSGIIDLSHTAKIVSAVSFDDLLLHGFLAVLLFAGALNVNASELKTYKLPITVFSTIGVAISTFVIGFALNYATKILQNEVPILYCLIFGALISPTDPVAVLSILNKQNSAQDLKIKITGEALFNDGTGVVLFIFMLSLIMGKPIELTMFNVTFLLFKQIIGGVILGLVLGLATYYILKSIDAYDVEILITITLAIGSFALAEIFGVSAPIATVIAGLVIGNKARHFAMSEKTKEHVDNFWNLMDEILNGVLFILMGLEIILINIDFESIVLSIIAIVVVIFARYLSVIASMSLFWKKYSFNYKTPILMTWGGLRGGISIALALSLPDSEYKNIILSITFASVIFSIVFQGMTLGLLIKKFTHNEKEAITNNQNNV